MFLQRADVEPKTGFCTKILRCFVDRTCLENSQQQLTLLVCKANAFFQKCVKLKVFIIYLSQKFVTLKASWNYPSISNCSVILGTHFVMIFAITLLKSQSLPHFLFFSHHPKKGNRFKGASFCSSAVPESDMHLLVVVSYQQPHSLSAHLCVLPTVRAAVSLRKSWVRQ